MSRIINALLLSDERLSYFMPSNGKTWVFREIPIGFYSAGKNRDSIYLPESDRHFRWVYDVKSNVSVSQICVDGLSATEGLSDKVKFCIERCLGGINSVDTVLISVGSNERSLLTDPGSTGRIGSWQLAQDIAGYTRDLSHEYVSIDSPVHPTKTFLGTGIEWTVSPSEQLARDYLHDEIGICAMGDFGLGSGVGFNALDIYKDCGMGAWFDHVGVPSTEYVNGVCENLSKAVNDCELKHKNPM